MFGFLAAIHFLCIPFIFRSLPLLSMSTTSQFYRVFLFFYFVFPSSAVTLHLISIIVVNAGCLQLAPFKATAPLHYRLLSRGRQLHDHIASNTCSDLRHCNTHKHKCTLMIMTWMRTNAHINTESFLHCAVAAPPSLVHVTINKTHMLLYTLSVAIIMPLSHPIHLTYDRTTLSESDKKT